MRLYFSENKISLEEKVKLEDFFNKRKRQKKELSLLEKNLKKSIINGDIEKVGTFLSKSFRNEIILSYLKKEELSGAKAYFGQRQFDDNNLEMLMIISYLEQSFYIDLQLNYSNGEWLIESFDERR